jgi:ferric-dicitrate binding protein FerR (iron transport regulator)
MPFQPLEYYINSYLSGSITPEEWSELQELLKDSDNWQELKKLMDIQIAEYALSEPLFPRMKDAIRKGVLEKIAGEEAAGAPEENPGKTRTVVFKRWYWAAAAAVLLTGTTAVYYMAGKKHTPPPALAHHQPADIAPGTNKAVLTLANGSTVSLDSSGARVIAQGSAVIRQQGGQLLYAAKGNSGNITYNTLNTPQGGQFQLQLSDGTRIWLNAASSITYPTAFTGHERRVEVKGEVYFEIAPSANAPFIVQVDDRAAIEVLGTAFNVNAYKDEKSLDATLLNGSIKVNGVVIKPGQQARIQPSSEIRIVKQADVVKALAWKNGLFDFEDAKLDEVMRQLARWYDIEVSYEGDIPDIEFIGKISRNSSLKGVLKGLERMGVHFRLDEGRKLVVIK